MSLLACWFALLPHGLQQPYTNTVHHEAPGSTARERDAEAVCVWSQVSVHMITCVDVFVLVFDFMLLPFFCGLYSTFLVSFVEVKALKQSQLVFESEVKF